MIKSFLPTLFEAIEKASIEILKVYSEDFEVEIKSDNSPVTIADKISSKIIIEHLSKFDIPIISEEEDKIDYSKRKDLQYVWLIDPVDGTKEFIKKSGQFCINIALIKDNKPYFGLIASPVDQKIIFGGEELGAFEVSYGEVDYLNDKWKIVPEKTKKNKVILHSNAGFSGTVAKFVRNLEKEYGKLTVVKKGSAIKFFDLVNGRADFYIRLAPTMEWDIAAGQAIYEVLGGEVFHFETKQPLTYNKPQLKNPNFIAKRKELKIQYE